MNKVTMENRVLQLNGLLLAHEAGFKLEYVRVWKNNTELEGYALRSEDNNCCPTVYYNPDWFSGDDEEVVSFLIKMYKDHSCSINLSYLTNRDYILSHIKPKLVSIQNKAELDARGFTNIPFLDMVVLFYIEVREFQEPNAMGTVQVTNIILNNANISIDDAYSAALKNLEQNIEIASMEEVISSLMGDEVTAPNENPYFSMYVCSTKNRMQGAAAMLCESVINALEERIGENFAILPSSIHEFIAVPLDEGSSFSALIDMVKEVNATQLSPEERLTDSVYCIKEHKLQIAV